MVPAEHPPNLGQAHPWEGGCYCNNRLMPRGYYIGKARAGHDIREGNFVPVTDGFDNLANLCLGCVRPHLMALDFTEAGQLVASGADLVFVHAKSPRARRL